MSLFSTLPRRRKIIFLLCLLVLITCFSIIYYKVFQLPRLNHAGFAQVQNGMSLAEVESLMGGPEGRYGKGPWMARNLLGIGFEGMAVRRTWEDHKSYDEIYFDDSDHVVG